MKKIDLLMQLDYVYYTGRNSCSAVQEVSRCLVFIYRMAGMKIVLCLELCILPNTYGQHQ